jgi:hypothetical protein
MYYLIDEVEVVVSVVELDEIEQFVVEFDLFVLEYE